MHASPVSPPLTAPVWARRCAQAGWWAFVVAVTVNIGAVGSTGPVRYAELTAEPASGFADHNLLAAVAVAGLVITVVGTIVQYGLPRCWGAAGVATVGTLLGASVIYLAAGLADPWSGSVVLRPSLVFALILTGVALRGAGLYVSGRSASGVAPPLR